MDMLSSFFNPGQAYTDAMNAGNNYYNQAIGTQQPYYQGGVSMLPNLQNMQQALMNPGQLENQWASSYTMSPYAQNLQGQATQAALNNASSAGLMGSSPLLRNIQQSSADIMQQDRQQYMNDLMQKYMQSIGIGENVYGVGANAANQISDIQGKQAQNAAFGTFGADRAPGALFGNLAGMGADLGINYMTGAANGGGFMGGMTGMGNALSKLLGGGKAA